MTDDTPPADKPDDLPRIQKWLSMRGVCSRREAERWLEEGRITINGAVVTAFGTKVSPEDSVKVDGKIVQERLPPKVYFMLNKPDLTLVSQKPEQGKSTVFELPAIQRIKPHLFCVGRLDFRTEGLLLMSNDGDFVHHLTHPSHKVPRRYQVLVNGKLSKEQKAEMLKGVFLKDGKVKGVKLHLIEGKNLGGSKGAWYMITVFEGRNRLVRRLFEHFELRVLRLIRTSFGTVSLPHDLAPGKARPLTPDELKELWPK